MCRIKLEVDAKTDVGQVKKVNQDNILVRVGELSGTEFGLFIICDGVNSFIRVFAKSSFFFFSEITLKFSLSSLRRSALDIYSLPHLSCLFVCLI